MNSRERVLCALSHRQPDRVPIDLGGTVASGIAPSTYHKLKKLLRISSPTRLYDICGMLAEVERPVLDRFGVDVIGLYPPTRRLGICNENWKPWQLFDGTPVEVPNSFDPVTKENGDLVLLQEGVPVALMPKYGFYFETLQKAPGAAHVDPETFEPPLLTKEELEHYRAQADALYQNTDFAIVAPLAPGPAEQLFRGNANGDFEGWMITLATEPEYVHALYEKLVAAWLKNLERFAQAVGESVHIIQCLDDLGTQQSQFISVQMFRRLIMPYYKRVFDWIHQNTRMKVLFHSDGAIFPLIPSLIEMGVDILNPVQTSAAGMDPVRLKKEFGDKLVFWGGSCDCQHTLPFGTPEEVSREAEENMRIFSPGGGYVFASVHNIQAGVPPENVIALYDTARSVVLSSAL
jgi:uroporphyrinogen decarboxylase